MSVHGPGFLREQVISGAGGRCCDAHRRGLSVPLGTGVRTFVLQLHPCPCGPAPSAFLPLVGRQGEGPGAGPARGGNGQTEWEAVCPSRRPPWLKSELG